MSNGGQDQLQPDTQAAAQPASRREVLLSAAAAGALGLSIAATANAAPNLEGKSMTGRFAIYQSVIRAWKAKDINAVLGHMSDDIVWHYAAAISPPLVGKGPARQFMEEFAGRIGEVRWRVFDFAESGDRLFVEGVDEYFTKDGVRVATPYAGVLDFRGDLICGWRDYFDAAGPEAMRAGGKAPAQVEQLISRPAVS
jgi:limonene-1,2-epoxide hydrolase